MYCTKSLPFLLLVLTGCTAIPGQDATSGKTVELDPLSASADEETDVYRKAITALNNAQLEQAESGFNNIIKNRPEFAGPWINLALIDIRKNNFADAEKHLAKALERNPKMPQVFNALGFVEMQRGDFTKALEHYRKAIDLKEDYALAHYNYALLQDVYLQDAKAAVQHYKRYLVLTDNQDKKTADWVLELERNPTQGSP
jgi:tetratricopeptide (TPR) repeat protein